MNVLSFVFHVVGLLGCNIFLFLPFQTKNNRPMKTSQIHGQDSNNGVTLLYSLRFDSVKGIATKRPPTMRQTLVNPTQKNPKHASVLQENSISYDHPLNPMQVAEIRAQRIQREKKQNQQQQAAAAAVSKLNVIFLHF